MDIYHNDKDKKEKLGSSVAGRPSDNLAYLPIKKRRPRLRSPSPPPPTPLDGICAPHNSVSDPKPLASNSLVEVQTNQVIDPLTSAAYKDNNSDDVHNAELGVNQEKLTPQETDACMNISSLDKTTTDALNSLAEVQKGQSIENVVGETNLSRMGDSSTIELLASVACKKDNSDDVHNAEITVKQERFLTPQGIDACVDMSSMEKTMTGTSNSLVEVQKSHNIENALVKTSLSRAEDTLLASAACKNNKVDNIYNVELGVKQEKLSTPQGIDATLKETLTGASKSLVEVQRNRSIENALVKNNIDGVHDADASVNQEKLLISEGTDACLGISSLGNTMTGIEEENVSLKVSASEAHNDSSDQIDSATVSLNLLDKSENDAKKGFGSEKGVRLHWDLNTVMDDWELPADDPSFGSKGNNLENISSEYLQSVESDKLVNNIGFDDSVNALRLSNCTSDIDGSPQLKSKLNNLCSGSSSEGRINTSTKLTMLAREDLCGKNVKLEKQDDILVDPTISDKSIRDMVPIKSEHEPIKFCEVPSVGNIVSKFTVPADAANLSGKSDSAVLPTLSSDNITVTPSVTTLDECQPIPVYIKKENDLCSSTKVSPLGNSLSDVEMKELMPKSYEQFGRSKIASLGNPSSDAIKELMSESYGQFVPPEAASLVNHSSDDMTKELISKSFEQCVPPKIASLVNPSLDVETKELLPKSYEQSPKVATQVNPSSNVEAKEAISMSYEQFGPRKIATLVNHSPVVETKELMPKSCELSGEVALEDPLDDGDVSDLSLGGHNHSVSLGKETKYPISYDSPFEDGEVRETDLVSWEENECETDCVDYDIDDRDDYEYGTDNIYMLEAGLQSIQNEENANFIEKGTCESVNSLKDSNTSASVENVSGQDQIATAVEANNSKTDEMVISDSIRRLDTKGSFTKEIQSRTMRTNLSSRVGESPASATIDEKDNVFIQHHRSGPRFQAGQIFRGDKYLGGDRHVPQMQDERRKSNWNGSSSRFLDSRNHFPNKYQRDGVHPLPRSIVPDSETGEYRDQRQSTNYSDKGGYRPFIRKRPLDNSDKDFSTQRRNVESRVDGHGMIRGGSGIYHRGGFRGPRGSENHGPISNDPAPSSGYMQERRRRSSSPILNRNPSFSRPCRRSRSRSRTRSPIPWRMQEERNKGPRIERTRIHYDDSKFEENDDAFCSPPRKRFSSQGNFGSFNDRNGGPSRFRERNSPGRFVGQRQRFDSRGSAERMKSDEGFRPGVHPQRFSKPSGEVWRGHNHDNDNNERTKYSNRNEMIHRGGRQSDNNGAIRRFHNNEDDSFDGHNNRNNKGWEGRGSFKYDRERN